MVAWEEINAMLQLLTAVLLFGSMFVPVKKFDAGDGFFAQWIMSVSILIVGFGVFAWQQFAHFYPVAMLGGVFWSLGNMMAVPIMKRLGMALGILIWNSTNCLVGWAIGTFGIFGIQPRPAGNVFLTGAGLIFVFVGGILFTQVKNKPADEQIVNRNGTYQVYQLNDIDTPDEVIDNKDVAITINGPEENNVDVNAPGSDSRDRLVGIGLALISGALYGVNISPVIYIQDSKLKYPDAPVDGLPYAFSHFFGAFIMCTIGFVVYALVKRNEPYINPNLAIPALLSGAIWGSAQTLLLGATATLSASITYPISATIPGCIASLWSIFYFREIEGTKNLIIMGTAILVTLIGAVCIGAAK
uniref:Transmembrane protein 144 n=1 Tax=Panagrellus redivivus TaxID=6233 RepID=A0A7E4UST2_PANRE